MTTIRFYRDHDRLSGFVCQGHSGYAQAGEDIVCAAVSSNITMVECIVNDVYHLGAKVTVDQEAVRISLKLPSSGHEGCEAVLEGFFRCMKELALEYPEHLTVLEV